MTGPGPAKTARQLPAVADTAALDSRHLRTLRSFGGAPSRVVAAAALAALLAISASACADNPQGPKRLSLAYFMGPAHPMNEAVFQPFAEDVRRLSGGKLEIEPFPGGVLNSSPPRQYSILLDGVADIVFALPGYTASLFPKTNLVSYPGVCESAPACTEALERARAVLETEYDAKTLAIWSGAAPVLLTRDRPVRALEDMRGLKLRVATALDAPFVAALGASAIVQPITVLHQNLATGVLDGVVIAASGIDSYKLQEPARYLTTWLPMSGTPFVLLMNRDAYAALSPEEQRWIDAASGPALSARGGAGYAAAAERGLAVSEAAGVELIELPESEKRRFLDAMASLSEAYLERDAGGMTVAEVLKLFEER